MSLRHWIVIQKPGDWVKFWSYKRDKYAGVGVRFIKGVPERYQAVVIGSDGNAIAMSEMYDEISQARRVVQQFIDEIDAGNIDMKMENIIHKIDEAFENYLYNPSTDKKELMFDFYLLSALPGTDDEDLNIALQESQTKLFTYLKKNMLDEVYFAVCAEFRHIFDANSAKEVKEYFTQKGLGAFIKKYSVYYLGKKELGYSGGKLGTFMDLRRPEMRVKHKEDNQGYRWSYQAAKTSGLNESQFMTVAKDAFTGLKWSTSYGGEAWARICDGWLHLYNTPDNNNKEMSIWIDHVYDLQHNTNTVFNKLKSYLKDNSYSWIKEALDWKLGTRNLYEFFDKTSPDLQRFAAAVIKNSQGTSLESWLKTMEAPERKRKENELFPGDEVKYNGPDIYDKKSKHSLVAGYRGKVVEISPPDEDTAIINFAPAMGSQKWRNTPVSKKNLISQYLKPEKPKEEPAKEEPAKEELVGFKIGDKVMSTKKPDDYNDFPNFTTDMEKYINQVGTVIGVDAKKNWINVKYSDGHEWSYKPSWLEQKKKTTTTKVPAPPKFKEGDIVEISTPGQLYSNYIEMAKQLGAKNYKPELYYSSDFNSGPNKKKLEKGTKGKVKAYDLHLSHPESYGYIYLIELENGDEITINEKGLSKIESAKKIISTVEKPKELSGFKIGDKVEYTGTKTKKLAGDTGTIVNFNKYNHTLAGVKWDALNELVWVSLKNIKPLSSAEKTKEEEPYQSDIQKGDMVKITDPGKLYPSYEEMAQKLGATNWEKGSSKDPEETGELSDNFKVIGVGADKDGDEFALIKNDKTGNEYLFGIEALDKTAPKDEIKSGDKIKYIGSEQDPTYYKYGDTGTVVKLSYPGKENEIALVKWDQSGKQVGVYSKDLELISKGEKTAGTFSEGDKVRYIGRIKPGLERIKEKTGTIKQVFPDASPPYAFIDFGGKDTWSVALTNLEKVKTELTERVDDVFDPLINEMNIGRGLIIPAISTALALGPMATAQAKQVPSITMQEKQIDMEKLLHAIKQVESSGGVDKRDRYEKGVDRQLHKRYDKLNHNTKDAVDKYGFKAVATSYGPYQIMASTAYDLGFNGAPTDLRDETLCKIWASKLINQIINSKRTNNVRDVVSAYNAGLGRIGKNPNYINKVMKYYK